MIIFGLRALKSYSELKSPLSKYFAFSGLLAGSSWLLWSMPFLFINPGEIEDKFMLMVFISLGDVMIFSALALQARIYWYLTLQNVIKFIYIAIPIGLISFAGLVFSIKSALENPNLPLIKNNIAILPINETSYFIQAVLMIIVIMVGIELLKSTVKQNTGRSRLSLVAISILYFSAGIGGIVNTLSSTVSNSSPIVVITHSLGLAFFFIVILVFRLADIRKSKI